MYDVIVINCQFFPIPAGWGAVNETQPNIPSELLQFSNREIIEEGEDPKGKIRGRNPESSACKV